VGGCKHPNKSFPQATKRGIVGISHNVSKKHLHLYVAEFDFRYNSRFDDDILRTVTVFFELSGGSSRQFQSQ
jgi:hypothetical protein